MAKAESDGVWEGRKGVSRGRCDERLGYDKWRMMIITGSSQYTAAFDTVEWTRAASLSAARVCVAKRNALRSEDMRQIRHRRPEPPFLGPNCAN